MSVFKKFNSMFATEEDEIYAEEENVVREQPKQQIQEVGVKKSSKVASNPMQQLVKKGDVVLVEPLVFADSKDIIDDLKANKVVILNLTKLDLQTCDRLLDFISGGIYAIDAKLKTIGDEIYLCVPKGVEVAGEFSEGEY